MYNIVMPENEAAKHTPFSELCKFADEYEYVVEVDKPFKEFEKLIIRVFDSNGEEIQKAIIDDIYSIDKSAGDILNSLSRKIK